MSNVPLSKEPLGLTVLAPEEALELARLAPSPAEMAIEGLTDDEWKAFEVALTDR
jgi:hypothetical protein